MYGYMYTPHTYMYIYNTTEFLHRSKSVEEGALSIIYGVCMCVNCVFSIVCVYGRCYLWCVCMRVVYYILCVCVCARCVLFMVCVYVCRGIGKEGGTPNSENNPLWLPVRSPRNTPLWHPFPEFVSFRHFPKKYCCVDTKHDLKNGHVLCRLKPHFSIFPKNCCCVDTKHDRKNGHVLCRLKPHFSIFPKNGCCVDTKHDRKNCHVLCRFNPHFALFLKNTVVWTQNTT